VLLLQLSFPPSPSSSIQPTCSILSLARPADVCIADNQNVVVLLAPQPGAELPVVHRTVQSWIRGRRTAGVGARIALSCSRREHLYRPVPSVLSVRGGCQREVGELDAPTTTGIHVRLHTLSWDRIYVGRVYLVRIPNSERYKTSVLNCKATDTSLLFSTMSQFPS
jgi:hypothetical protein